MNFEKDIERMRNAIALLKLMIQGENDIRAERLVEQDEVFSRIEARLTARKEPVA